MKPNRAWLLGVLVILSCQRADAPLLTPRARLNLDVQNNLNEEELIGDRAYLAYPTYQVTGLGPRSSYMIRISPSPGSEKDRMFYHQRKATGGTFWGWYSSLDSACISSTSEVHDIDGDTLQDSGIERHCIQNGEYTVTFWHVHWNQNGIGLHDSTLLFIRRIAMLGALGVDSAEGTDFHDVRITLDEHGGDTALSLFGSIRAGDYYVKRFSADSTAWYPRDTSFTEGAGDTLWFISTYLASGSQSRPWYNVADATLNSFNFDVERHAASFSGDVNSVPANTSPFMHAFDRENLAQAYKIVSRPTLPFDYDDQNDPYPDTIRVTAVAVAAAFTWPTPVSPGSVTFDGRSSTAYGTREYAWAFQNGGFSAWSAADSLKTFTLSPAGNYQVKLRVRRQGSTAPVDSVTHTVSAGSPVSATFIVAGDTGIDLITQSGSYLYVVTVSGGIATFTHEWHYHSPTVADSVVGGDAVHYTQSVTVHRTDSYVFRLIDSLTDSSQPIQHGRGLYFVEVIGGGGGELAAGGEAGVRLQDGSCGPRPPSGPERQAWLAWVFDHGAVEEGCVIPVE